MSCSAGGAGLWARAPVLCFLWSRVVCCQAGLLVVPVGGGPPASRPRRALRSARRLAARPGPAAAHGHRSQALRCLHAGGLFCVRYRSGSPAMSHVIPLQVFQTLNSERWNCNVFGRSRKMTEGNYVRLLFGVSPFIEALPGLPVPFTSVLPGVWLCLWLRWCSGRRRPLLCEIPEWFPSNVARNSHASISNIEFRTLELQCFRAVSKNDRRKLRATFVVM